MQVIQRFSRHAMICAAAIILAACASQKEPAQKLIGDIEATVTAASGEAATASASATECYAASNQRSSSVRPIVNLKFARDEGKVSLTTRIPKANCPGPTNRGTY